MLKRLRDRLFRRNASPFRGQVGQDLWVLETLGGKRGGFFVEIGATDGVSYSNTYGLEQELGWTGICIEPNPREQAQLRKNRKCTLVQALCSSEAGRTLTFQIDGTLSGVRETAGGMMRENNEVLSMTTTTLAQVLTDNRAPHLIDYLSLDVEGHELEVLSGLWPSPFKFRCITIEHNEPHQGPAMRMALRERLQANGYRFVKGNDDIHNWGHGPIDDFYVIDDPSLLP